MYKKVVTAQVTVDDKAYTASQEKDFFNAEDVRNASESDLTTIVNLANRSLQLDYQSDIRDQIKAKLGKKTPAKASNAEAIEL